MLLSIPRANHSESFYILRFDVCFYRQIDGQETLFCNFLSVFNLKLALRKSEHLCESIHLILFSNCHHNFVNRFYHRRACISKICLLKQSTSDSPDPGGFSPGIFILSRVVLLWGVVAFVCIPNYLEEWTRIIWGQEHHSRQHNDSMPLNVNEITHYMVCVVQIVFFTGYLWTLF
jgi:hypothetical protein